MEVQPRINAGDAVKIRIRPDLRSSATKNSSSLRLGGLNNRRLASADGAEAGFFVFSDIRIFRVDTDASGAVAGFYFGESRDNAFAVVDGKRAARVERAAFWRIDGGGDVAC